MKAAALPPVVEARAAKESFGLPEPIEGWTWASVVAVEDDEWLEFPELDELVMRAAREAGAASLGFAVMDSDSVYLVGGDSTGIRFHLVVNEDAFEDDLPAQDVDGAAAWARDQAPLAPSSDELRDVLSRRYVFAEDGLDVLFARMGLLPPEAAEASDELDEEDVAHLEEQLRHPGGVQDAEAHPLEGERWFASLSAGRLNGAAIAVEEDARINAPPLVRRLLRPHPGISGYWLGEPPEPGYLGHFKTVNALTEMVTALGYEIGPWQAVPEDVEWDLASTAAWVRSRRGIAGA